MTVSPDELLQAHGAWLRRLAAALVRDGSAEDLVQETWETAMRRPPRDLSTLRSWLRRVLVNRQRNEARTAARRHAREVAAGAMGPAEASSAEDAALAMELQHRISAAVATLCEQERRVIHLRYFEDLSPSDIARRLGVPAGTVRWRLKVALDTLRTALDQQHAGERRRWQRLLVPLLPSPRRSGRLAVVAAASAVMLAGPVLVASRAMRDHRTEPGREANGAAQRPRAFVATTATPVPATACPEADALRGELALREREAEQYDHRLAFLRSPPNAVAFERFAPVVESAIVPPCSHGVECRGRVCRVQLLLPEGVHPGKCFRAGKDTIQGIPAAYLDWRGVGMTMGGPVRDAVSGEGFTRMDLSYRLASLDGEPVAKAPAPEPLARGRHRRPPSLPAERDGRCRAEVLRLHDQLIAAEWRVDVRLPPAATFPLNEPNPELEPEVARELGRLLTFPRGDLPFRIECRGPTCAVEPRAPAAPETVASWITWFQEIEYGKRRSRVLAEVKPPMSPGTIWVRVRPEAERAGPTGLSVICELARRERDARVLERCQEAHPGPGTLDLQLYVPDPTYRPDAPRRITIHRGGPLSALPVGRCVFDGLDAIANALDVSGLRTGLTSHYAINLPTTSPLWGQTCAPKGPLRGLE